MSAPPVPVRFEVAFGGTWYDEPGDLTWTDISERGLETVTWSRGRTPEMVRTPQPGQLSVDLESFDADLTPGNAASPYYPDVQPGLPVRLSVQDETGVWVPCSFAYATSFTPALTGGLPDWTVVTLDAVDGWGRVMQAGTRMTVRDRVLLDLAAGRDIGWIAGDVVEVSEATGRTDLEGFELVGVQDFQQWGMGWWALSPGGLLDWSTPGVAGVLAETGLGDSSAPYNYNQGAGQQTLVGQSAGFASDRHGGQLARNSTASLVNSCFGVNFVRQQISVGRPPTQLLPASVCDPTSTTGWSASAGTVTRVAASGLSWVPMKVVYDPATGSHTSVVDGPAGALSWARTGLPKLTATRVAVTAGTTYAAHVGVAGATTGYWYAGLSVDWYNSAGTLISTTAVTPNSTAYFSPTPLSGLAVAPAGAVTAAVVIDSSFSSDTSATIQIHAPGLYPALPIGPSYNGNPVLLPPARWWAPGADAHLHLSGQFPVVNPATGKTGSGWLHCDGVVDSLADGVAHQVSWNVTPGNGGKPTLWVDGVEVAASWWFTDPGTVANGYGWLPSTTRATPVMFAAGVGTAYVSATPNAPVTTIQPGAVTTKFAVSGVQTHYRATPVDALVDRWQHQYGAPASLGVGDLNNVRTDVAMGSILDALAWPQSLRALQPGRSTVQILWDDTAEDGTTTMDDYSTAVTALVSTEFGWADVDTGGNLRWLPRRWYDPDLDGIAAAVAHLTWRDDDPAAYTYTSDNFTQVDADDNVTNQVLVTPLAGSGLDPALLEDYDSQRRIGIRPDSYSGPWRTQGEVDEVADEVFALTGRAQALPTSVALSSAYTPISAILALNPADVVLVTVPQLPADDLTVAAIINQISYSTDGLLLTAVLTLGPCPVPASMPLWPGAALFPSTTLYPGG